MRQNHEPGLDVTHHFHIATLPRCRSAWLANLFTGSDMLCHHEIMRTRWAGGEELALPWSNETALEGACGTDLAVWPELPGFPLVLVTRPEAEIRASLGKTFGRAPEPHRVLDLALAGIELLRPQASLEVEARALGSLSVIEEIARVLAIKLPPSFPARFEIVRGLNIQTDYNSITGGYRATDAFRNIFAKIDSR